ncbi:MAG: hypothetical protein Rpha_0015 [Candidatus Ruthia sp. Apha_13_S6]|nr:hypothetical protein [Candidatus Ruthia sp. Apha_13_S6]MBW5289400.1 hypothetical protein [Candidatus Ruthia sp. Apha_13_S6]
MCLLLDFVTLGTSLFESIFLKLVVGYTNLCRVQQGVSLIKI